MQTLFRRRKNICFLSKSEKNRPYCLGHAKTQLRKDADINQKKKTTYVFFQSEKKRPCHLGYAKTGSIITLTHKQLNYPFFIETNIQPRI